MPLVPLLVPMVPLPVVELPVVEPLTDGEVAVPVDEVSEPVPSVPELELPAWPVALPVPVPDPAVPAVPALVPPVLPVPELPLPPVCAIAPAATSAAAERIVAANFPMFMNFLLVGAGWPRGRHLGTREILGDKGGQSRARSYCGGQRTCTPSCFAAARGQYGSRSSWRARITTSAWPVRRMCSA